MSESAYYKLLLIDIIVVGLGAIAGVPILSILGIIVGIIYYDCLLIKKVFNPMRSRDIFIHIGAIGFGMTSVGMALADNDELIDTIIVEVLLGLGIIMGFLGALIAYQCDINRCKKEQLLREAQLTDKLKKDFEQLREKADASLSMPNEYIVSLMPPGLSYYNQTITPELEKDILLAIVNNRKEAFDVMRGYLEFNQIQTIDVSELELRVCGTDNNVLEVAQFIQFSNDDSVSADVDTGLSGCGCFLLRSKTYPKYDTVPSLEEWVLLDNMGKRSAYTSAGTHNEYAYRDVKRYLEAKSTKAGDD